jgi:hypothetical protein
VRTFHCSQEVAVMPEGARSPRDVLRIAHVASVNRAFIRTDEHRIYAASDGRAFNGSSRRYIVPATEEHRAVLRTKHSAAS